MKKMKRKIKIDPNSTEQADTIINRLKAPPMQRYIGVSWSLDDLDKEIANIISQKIADEIDKEIFENIQRECLR